MMKDIILVLVIIYDSNKYNCTCQSLILIFYMKNFYQSHNRSLVYFITPITLIPPNELRLR
ncbi:Uncharacterised protein [Moraxella lacunata]|uniref:Uncharacterized protein n=1 Tax=Moraxella lacunata TaxID=477 RepID=A0A378QIY4_MORLA|nr:Uncharacterised protein [Moraxella lacunata]